MKLNKKYLAPLCSLFVTGGLLLTIGIMTMASSFGWFSNNDRVTASGLSVSSVSPYKTSQTLYKLDETTKTLVPLTDSNNDVFSGMLPGKTYTVYLGVTNEDTVDLNLELLLSAPAQGKDDVSITDDNGNFCYFGSQIRVSAIGIADCTKSGDTITYNRISETGKCILANEQAYLLTVPDVEGEESFYNEDGLQGVAMTEAQKDAAFAAATQKKMSSEIQVAKNATVYVAITFEFVENNQVQNDYIEFGVTSAGSRGALSRTLLCWYSEGSGS